MPRTTTQDRARALIAEVETLAQRLQADMRRRAQEFSVARQLEKAAARLRKRAASAAALVERYVHRLRIDLEKGVARKAPKRRKASAVRSRARTRLAPPRAAAAS